LGKRDVRKNCDKKNKQKLHAVVVDMKGSKPCFLFA
jgi:hypothetical protein